MPVRKKTTSKGEGKILNAFKKLVLTKHFVDEVSRIRKLCEIPENGYTISTKELEKILKHPRGERYVPNEEYFSKQFNSVAELKEWHSRKGRPSASVLVSDQFGYTKNVDTLKEEVLKISKELLPAQSEYFELLIRFFVLYNEFYYDELDNYLSNSMTNVCKLEDAEMEFDNYSLDGDSPSDIKSHNAMLENKLKKYPVVLRIHPDASQGDVIDYLRKQWWEIAKLQSKYRIKNKTSSFRFEKSSKIKNQDRNNFIFEHRHLKSKEIARLTNERFNTDSVGYELVNTIIYQEKKKRDLT